MRKVPLQTQANAASKTVRRLHSTSVAILYDKATIAHGGAEHVLAALQSIFPDATFFSSISTDNSKVWRKNWKTQTTFLQHIPFVSQLYKVFTPVVPLAFESLDLSEFPVVISVTSDQAKAALTHPDQVHVCYLLTPPRYLYSHAELYAESEELLRNSILGALVKPLLSYLKRFDQVSARRPDFVIPISNLVGRRAKKAYNYNNKAQTDTQLLLPIYPPIPAVQEASQRLPISHFLLSASRLVAYKRIDLAILAAVSLQQALVIAGDGVDAKRLQRIAPAVTLIRQNNEELTHFLERARLHNKTILFTKGYTEAEFGLLSSNAKLFILPGLEDFGITPLQVAGVGLPSVIHADSGVSEILTPKYATHIHSDTLEALTTAIARGLSSPINKQDLRALAQSYSEKNFTTQFFKVVYDLFIQKESER